MVIDKNRKSTPKRVIWKKNEFKAVYTDHFTLEILISGMPRRNQKVGKVTAWNLGKPGGWESYERLTNRRAEEVDQLVDKEDIPIDQIVKEINDFENEIKFKTFGKTRINKSIVKNL